MGLEQVVRAVDEARLVFLMREVASQAERWLREKEFVESSPERVLAELSADVRGRAGAIWSDKALGIGELDPSAPMIVTYVSSHEDETVSYAIGDFSRYERVSNYRIPSRNQFYVHVPPGATIRTTDSIELGSGVLGTAHMVTGEIRLLDTLDAAERTEVLLHESLHLLYPMHSERQIRDLVRTVMGKQYCRFH